MVINTNEEAIVLLKAHQQLSPKWQETREYSKELKALVNGEMFIEELIEKIDHVESAQKAKARTKYSRSVQDLFSRLFQPIETIGFATGDSREYEITNRPVKDKFLKKISNIRDNKPLSEWVLRNAIDLINTDPNGIIFLEYTTNPVADIYPTYKSVNSIRYYKAKGQLLDYVIFEPKIIDQKEYWRIVCDEWDRTFLKEGLDYYFVDGMSFGHPFGQVPAVICSNIQLAGQKHKLAAIHPVVPLAKEYARDQSFLTLYKIYKGNPIFWRYVSYCGDCNGTGKIGTEICTSCNGVGKHVSKNDVTDVVELPIPDDKESPIIAPNIAGFISPDLDVWVQYNKELNLLEQKLYKSHWGTMFGMQIENAKNAKTATEIVADKQPLENQLNKYADYIEYMEWKLSEWILNFYDVKKDRTTRMITINRGRRYIIESYDILLERYMESVSKEENSTILDKLFIEYINSKYRNNVLDLQMNLLKARCEPYLHITLSNVIKIFGTEEAQRKVLFQKFWQSLDGYKPQQQIESEFATWFEQNKVKIAQPTIQNEPTIT